MLHLSRPCATWQAFNVLRYNLNQKYDSHMDTFDPKDFGPQPSQRMATVLLYLSEVEDGGETVFKKEGEDGERRLRSAVLAGKCMHCAMLAANRLPRTGYGSARIFLLLSRCCAEHVPHGLPLRCPTGADRPVTDWASCEPGEFKYKPRMGDAVLFFSLDPDLAINPRSLHGGCAVRSGEKWVATKWIHEKPFQRRRA